jgi:hypothetical protein
VPVDDSKPVLIPVAIAVLRHPTLWSTAARQIRRSAAPGWWHRKPFLPIPSDDYVQFRMLTQYGTTDRRPDPADVISYLNWCRDWCRDE